MTGQAKTPAVVAHRLLKITSLSALLAGIATVSVLVVKSAEDHIVISLGSPDASLLGQRAAISAITPPGRCAMSRGARCGGERGVRRNDLLTHPWSGIFDRRYLRA